MTDNHNKITLMALVMMIFTTVFGFANSTVAFYLMGYSSILFYLVAAVLFFIPFALMMAEYGAAIKSDEGSGMYQWLEVSVSPRFAFIGTFMWFAPILSGWSRHPPRCGFHLPRCSLVAIRREILGLLD